jgi:hypothetical protein
VAADGTDRPATYPAGVRIAKQIIYWLAVLAISVALVILLILFFESRDQSSVESGAVPAIPA